MFRRRRHRRRPTGAQRRLQSYKRHQRDIKIHYVTLYTTQRKPIFRDKLITISRQFVAIKAQYTAVDMRYR